MKIIDTNGITHILANNLNLQESYYLVPDVAEESDLAQMVHGRRMPSSIKHLSQSSYFDQVSYLDHYKTILNKYGGRSFYNMTGFGDVSTIAAIHMILNTFDKQAKERLFVTIEPITVFTNDNGLTAKIVAEFIGRDVSVRSIIEIS